MIKIICVGKIKESFYKEAIKEYEKRIIKYTKLKIIEVDDYAINNENIIKQKEACEIIKYIENKDYIITLEIEGKSLTSVDFSKKIEEINQINSNITFIIGDGS